MTYYITFLATAGLLALIAGHIEKSEKTTEE